MPENGSFPAAPAPVGNPLEPAVATAELHTATEYRVVCPLDRWVCLPSPLLDYHAANDLRLARDAEIGTNSLHRDCAPHRIEERTVTYGEWQ